MSATYSKGLKANSLQAAKTWQSAKTQAYVAFTLQALDGLNWGEGKGQQQAAIQNAIRMVMFDAGVNPTDRSRVSSTAVRLAAKVSKHYQQHKLITAAKDASSIEEATEALTSFLSGLGVKAAYQFEAWAKSADAMALSKAASKAALADKVGGVAKAATPAQDDAKSEEPATSEEPNTIAVIDTSEKALAAILPAVARLNNRDLKRLEAAIAARRESLTAAAQTKRAAKAVDVDAEIKKAA
jgi:hypothetical protein